MSSSDVQVETCVRLRTRLLSGTTMRMTTELSIANRDSDPVTLRRRADGLAYTVITAPFCRVLDVVLIYNVLGTEGRAGAVGECDRDPAKNARVLESTLDRGTRELLVADSRHPSRNCRPR
jgi:hypothetical protein